MRQVPIRPGIPPRFLLLALALHLGLAGGLLWRGRGEPAPRPEPLPVMVSLVPDRPAPAARAELPPPAPQTSVPRSVPTPSKPVAAQKPAPERVQTPTPTASPAPTAATTASPAATAPAASSNTSPTETGGVQTASVSAPRFDAAYLHNPKPPYPLLARRRGVEGKVLLKVQVSAAGLAEQVQIAQSSGHDSLDEAALNTVRTWRFVPAQRGDTPVAAAVLVPITFKLEN
ncbi:energy transducer TonB [Azovibrio restrictus]|uniref:energy transducer TonB n=1 Tax=Azovibrio restrictus TaxID=146938 RepID=UPI0026F27212|nr:energy transducer TonB [Azovibrio restrictus]